MTTIYFISYDLRKEHDYETLYKQLEEMRAIRVLESLWCFKIESDIEEHEKYRDNLRKYMDENDGIIVIKAAGFAWHDLNNPPYIF